MHNTQSKKILLAGTTVLGLCLLISSPVFAQVETGTGTSATSTRPQDRLEERRETILENQAERAENIEARQASSTARQEAITERQTERTEVREERQATLAAFRQDRIINLAANISNRMDAATERLFNLIGRLEVRMQKLTQAGYDTTAAEAKLRAASQTLAEAKTAMADIDALVYAATTSEQPRSNWQTVRERYVVVGNLIRQTHAELRETIALLKTAVSGGAGVSDAVRMNTATGTSSTTATGTNVMQSI